MLVTRGGTRICAAALGAGLWLGLGRHGPPGQQRVPTLARRSGTFASPLLRESSGVAASRRFPGVLWTHNDSGDGPFLYATNLAGEDLGRYFVPAAQNVDWEDIALAPCPGQSRPCLYVADTGDNGEHRKSVTVYAVPEPTQRPTPPGEDRRPRATEPARPLRIRYPDRPHDLEAMWVNPDGSLALVSKGMSGPMLRYLVPQRSFERDSVTAERMDPMAIVPQRTLGRLVTGADISPSGQRVAIRTYTEIFFYHRADDRRLEPDGAPCWLGTLEAQGEGVAFMDDSTLVLTSEAVFGQPGTIYRVRC